MPGYRPWLWAASLIRANMATMIAWQGDNAPVWPGVSAVSRRRSMNAMGRNGRELDDLDPAWRQACRMIGDFRESTLMADRINTQAVAVETGHQQQMPAG